MNGRVSKNYDKLRKKHIWPSIVLFFVVMGISVLCFGMSLAFYIEYLADSKMTVGFEKANEIKNVIDNRLANGMTYEEALLSLAGESKDELSVCILDENNNVLCSVGNITIDLSERNESLSVDFGFEDQEDESYYFYWDREDENQSFGFTENDGHILHIIRTFLRGESVDERETTWFRATVIQFPYWVTSLSFPDGSRIALQQTLRVKRYDFVFIFVLGVFFLIVIAIVLFVLIGNIIGNVRYQRRIAKLVSTDSVTGGKNWFYFSTRATRILSKSKNAKKSYAVIDFEWMKYRNFCGLHGVKEGEEKLTQLLAFIQTKLKKNEICARYEKANLAVLLYSEDTENAGAVMEERIGECLKEIPQALGFSNLIFHVGIFDVDTEFDETGIVVRRKDVDIEKFYGNAGIARASIEEDNESGIKHFNQKMWDEQMWEHKVNEQKQRALDNEEFLVYIQPKYHPVTEELSGAEALIRWQNPIEGFLPPGRFIPIFEKSSFITKIDDYMISHVAKLQAEWLAKGKKVVPVSINVSRVHFAQPDLAEHIASLVDAYNVPHQYIEIELTESAFFDDRNALLGTIRKLKELGFDVSMDDFGAGYSSLNSLKDLPLDVLKLDADFFRGEETGDRGEIIVSQAIDLAKHLNMRIVAEGIEKKEQVDFLAKCGCDMIQGYYFAKPMPASDYETRMNEKE